MIKEIPSYPGYFADEEGNIWSNRWGKMKKLKPHNNGKNKLGINICYNQKRKYIKVHRLVSEAFHGTAGEEVHHIDGNTLNNRPENLMPLTREQHLHEHGKKDPIAEAIRLLESNGYTVSFYRPT